MHANTTNSQNGTLFFSWEGRGFHNATKSPKPLSGMPPKEKLISTINRHIKKYNLATT
jgi:hypothetical protein